MSKLTLREKTLLVILLILVVIGGYMLLFRMPTTEKIQDLSEQTKLNQELLTELDEKVSQKNLMQNELDNIFNSTYSPATMPDYDNIKSVIFVLNEILKSTNEYAVSFETVDTSKLVVERYISLPFTCNNYQTAYNILNELENSQLRCMIDDVNITQNEDGTITVNAGIIFFEYNTEFKAAV